MEMELNQEDPNQDTPSPNGNDIILNQQRSSNARIQGGGQNLGATLVLEQQHILNSNNSTACISSECKVGANASSNAPNNNNRHGDQNLGRGTCAVKPRTNTQSFGSRDFNSNKASILTEEFKENLKDEHGNVKVLLNDHYTGNFSQKDVLSDQKKNEPFLLTFFEKYSKGDYKILVDALAIMLAALYAALGDLEGAKTNLARIRNPDDNEDPDIRIAYYIMQANLEIEANNFQKAQELLKQCYDIRQYLFDSQGSFQDFYETTLGRIYLKEGKVEEAEKCFNEALDLRLSSNNPRLISSSYNDLVLLYIQRMTKVSSTEADTLRNQASQYLEEAYKYNKIFQEELEKEQYDLLSGSVDFKKPDLDKTKEVLKKMFQEL